MALGIKKGDTVLVISGRHKGAVGRVLANMPKKGKAIVERVAIAKKHSKAKSQQQPGGIVEREMPIPLSKLMLVDPKTGRAAKFKNEVTPEGHKIRRSKATGNEI